MEIEKLQKEVVNDELDFARKPVMMPEDATLLKCLQHTDFKFADNINTPTIETVQDVVTAAFKKAVPAIAITDIDGGLEWGRYKDAGIRHLLRLEPLSRFHLPTGGGANIINATQQF